MITFSLVQKKDLPILAEIYVRAFNAMGEKWTKSTSQSIVAYRYAKKVRIKVMYKKQIIGAFFADIKPLYFGNILHDGDVFIDPDFQQLGIGRWLFVEGMQYAKKNFNVIEWEFFTFRNSYQYKRYKKIGFSTSDKWILMTGTINDVLKNMKQKYKK